ncbi:MAG: TraR/DksA C4-type zinc finger protein [Candidatus Cloacimonetes bacterium]|nr:TraR/DksA C4-type zinc finger protein [Candidatus Cloacimonadota bacterium]
MEMKKLAFYKDLILKEREKTVKIIEGIDKSWSKTIRDSAGDISAYTTHLADLASDNNEREKDTATLERELRNLKKLDIALRRIYDKTFGICVFCGAKISEKRLIAIPFAEMCIKCKRNSEGANNNH